MAKTDNLTDFLTGVANAIRTKKGTTAKINPQNFESEIESIKGNKFIDLVQRTIKTVTEDDLQGLIHIEVYAFINCYNLTSVTIPDSVIDISNYAFSSCIRLTNVTIPNSVTSIAFSAFYNCRDLKSITIPDSVTSIGDNAFKACSGLTSVTMLPTTPPTLGSNVFPSNVTTITVPVGCGNAYKTAKNWSNYADKIVEAAA